MIDDVDAAALGEDVAAHFRVPTPSLVPEMDAGLEQFPHGDHGHGCSLLIRFCFQPVETDGTGLEQAGTPIRPTHRVVRA